MGSGEYEGRRPENRFRRPDWDQEGLTMSIKHQQDENFEETEGLALTPMEIDAKEVLNLNRKLNEMLAQHTGQSIETIERDTDRDNFMSAEDAVKYGLIDKVLTNRTESAAA